MKNTTPKKGEQVNQKESKQKHKEKHQKINHREAGESTKASKEVKADKRGKRKDTTNDGGVRQLKMNGNAATISSKEAKLGSPAKTRLEEAIYALGGDEEDYLLVKNVDEDAGGVEQEINKGAGSQDKVLQGDLKKMMKSLGLKDTKKDKEPEGWIVQEADESETSDDGSEESNSSKAMDEDEDDTIKSSKVGRNINGSFGTAAAPSSSKRNAAGSKFIFPPDPRWYEVLQPLPHSEAAKPPNEHTISALYTQAERLITADTALYTDSPTHVTSTSDATFLSRVLSSGTLSDRLSALTLMVQASPVHNMRALETLKGMAAKRGGAGAGKAEGVKALRAMVDWWIGGGAPGRKLRYFRDQPLQHPNRTDAYLIVWYFEDWLKKLFFSVLQILEALTHDPLSYMRLQSLQFLTTLLTSQPEQEHNLLKLLANKLGDSERSIASRASYHLLNTLQVHPGMKGVLVREVADLILKPASQPKPSPSKTGKAASKGGKGNNALPKGGTANVNARYYGIVTFNQIVLSSKTPADKDVANRLVEVYFAVFRSILGEGKLDEDGDGTTEQDGATNERDGKGREEKRKLREKDRLRTLRRNGANASQGGLVDGNANDSDSKLVSALLTGVNRALVFATMDDAVLDKQMDTLFRLTHEGGGSFNVAVQALGLIGKVAERRPIIHTRFLRALYSTLFDPRLGTSSKQAMYLNLLFKFLKADKNLARVKAFVKRFIQVLVCGGSGGGSAEMSFVCGGLYLLGELFSVSPTLRTALTSSPSHSDSNAEHQAETYDPRKREPEFAGAADACIWELTPLLNHYHPSVSLHTRQLLENVTLTANADLALNTFSHFLDLFVYKNPKKPKPRGASAMQPAAIGREDPGTVRMIKGWGDGLGENGMVNSEEFWRKQVDEIPASQLFFHKFFNKKMERRKVEKKIEKEDVNDVEGDDQSDDSDPEEAEIWKAMQRSIPAAEGAAADLDDESDGLPDPEQSGSEAESDGSNAKDSSDGEESESEASDASEAEPSRIEEEDAGSSEGTLEFAEDPDDVLDSDAQVDESVGDGLIHFSSDDEPWQGIGSNVLGKRKRKPEQEGERKKKRRLKDLPLFASLEDYEKLIDAQPEDNI